MKLLATFSFLLIALSFSAQTSVYHPFPDSNAVWVNTFTQYCCTGGPCSGGPCSAGYQHILDGDTTIFGKPYHKLYKEGYQPGCSFDTMIGNIMVYSCGGFGYYRVYEGAIRNDVAQKKVYFAKPSSATEDSLYDFSLNIGDTINTVVLQGVLARVDSIYIGGNYRKGYYYTRMTYDTVYVIEGIGAVELNHQTIYAELFDIGPCVCSWDWNFSCFHQDGSILYGDTTCTFANGMGTHEKPVPGLSAHPNPVSGSVFIESSLVTVIPYNLVNVLGQIRSKGSLMPGRNTVDLSLLDGGLYYLISEGQPALKIQVSN